MARLDIDYVNAWVLAKHLPELARQAEDPYLRALLEKAHESYLYPVDSQVYSSEGELLDHVGANDLPGDGRARYHQLLDAGVREE